MSDYLLDCNHLSAAISKVSRLRERIRLACKQGDRFITCTPTLCELEAGIQQTASPPAYRRRLDNLLRHVRIWPLDRVSAQTYGEIFNDLRRRGRALSQVDMMLAALARQHTLRVLTADRDFSAVPDVATEDWTSSA